MTAYFFAHMIRFITAFFLAFFLIACQQEQQYTKISGSTMGTTYQVTFDSSEVAPKAIKNAISEELELINQLMSTYIPDSEINQFNRASATQCFSFSDRTWAVLIAARDIYHKTHGAFDITVGPLVQRWGFDAAEYETQVPTDAEVTALLENVGTDKLEFNFAEQCVTKSNSELTINLSAIAKGYAVDQLSNIMEDFGVKHYLVEIGGETKGVGLNLHGLPWRIAVEKPSSSTSPQQELLIIALDNTSIATSGDYRNYFEVDGKRFSHTIDPTTGYPITHQLTSVSVIHPSNMYADGYATAMSVMGSEKSLAFAEEYQLPILVIERSGDTLTVRENSLFEAFKVQP